MRAIGLVLLMGVVGCSPGGTEEAAEESTETAAARERVYVDVRSREEFAAGHLEGAINIPHTEMAERWGELEIHRDDSLIVYCRTGRRSGLALEVLREQGFEYTRNGVSLENVRSGR